jgi:hypothetical protein
VREIEAETVLEQLMKVAILQRQRVLTLWGEEMKSGLLNLRLERALNLYVKVLLSIQNLRFELGLDEKKLPLSRAKSRPLSWKQRAEKVEREAQEIDEACAAAKKDVDKFFASLSADRSGVQNPTTEINGAKTD